MTLVDRLKTFMEYMGIPISQFADMAQIPRPTLSQILGGRNKKISNELLEKLHSAFPNLNISWLLFGDGAMTIEGVSAPEISVIKETTIEETPQPEIVPTNEIKKAEAPAPAQQIFIPRASEPSESEIAFTPDTSKKIKSIIVFYSDNSFETFNPCK